MHQNISIVWVDMYKAYTQKRGIETSDETHRQDKEPLEQSRYINWCIFHFLPLRGKYSPEKILFDRLEAMFGPTIYLFFSEGSNNRNAIG
jgi:hypothetical protein